MQEAEELAGLLEVAQRGLGQPPANEGWRESVLEESRPFLLQLVNDV